MTGAKTTHGARVQQLLIYSIRKHIQKLAASSLPPTLTNQKMKGAARVHVSLHPPPTVSDFFTLIKMDGDRPHTVPLHTAANISESRGPSAG